AVNGVGHPEVAIGEGMRQPNSIGLGRRHKVFMIDLNICALGDGFVKGLGEPDQLGWAGRLVQAAQSEHGPINYYNLGIPGETSPRVAQRIPELSVRLPKGADNRLIVCCGLMDTFQEAGLPGVTNLESVDALKSLLLQSRAHFKMLVIGLPPVYEPQRNARVKRLNGLMHDLCVKIRVPYIDLFSSLNDNVQYKRELLQGDRLHPGSDGYNRVFELIRNDRAWWFS
ncbi:MAG: acyl-CoA thioesterase-1, partial [Reinekea sp.]